MVASAARHLTPSQVIDPITGEQIKHDYRTSSDMRFWHAFQDLVIYCFLLRISQATGLPITNGIITALNRDQAIARSCPPGPEGGRNLGVEAARAAVEMANLVQSLDR